MKSWVKGVLLLLTGLVLVAAALAIRVYMNTPKPQTVVLTPPPTPSDVLTVEGLQPPAVKPEWVTKMQAYEARAHWLDTPTWAIETVEARGRTVDLSFWQLPLVSTGQTNTVRVRLRDGQTLTLQVLYTLQFNAFREVVLVPLVITVTTQGQTISFFQGNTLPSLGQVIMAFADAPLATPIGFDWSKCTPYLLVLNRKAPISLCALGRDIEAQWPDYTGLVLRRVIPKGALPKNFLLYGLRSQPVFLSHISNWEVSP